MNKNTIIQLILVITLFISCNKAKSPITNEQNAYEVTATDEIVLQDITTESNQSSKKLILKSEADISDPNLNTIHTVQTKRIIRKGSISIESKNNKITKSSIDKLVKDTKSYYESENSSSGSSYMNYSLIVRIPYDQFDYFVQNLENGKDKITQKTISAEDVSLQYTDIESRLKSKKAYLERYQQMVSSAKTTKDLLEIEEQIRQLQEDIESNASLLRSLSDQINYSTLTIDILYAESGNIFQPTTYMDEIQLALKSGWMSIKELTIAITKSWPIILLLTLCIVYAFRKFKNIRKNKSI